MHSLLCLIRTIFIIGNLGSSCCWLSLLVLLSRTDLLIAETCLANLQRAHTHTVSHFCVSVRAISVCLSSSRSGLNVCPDWIGVGVGIEQYHTHTQTPRASVSLSHFSVLWGQIHHLGKWLVSEGDRYMGASKVENLLQSGKQDWVVYVWPTETLSYS